MSNMNTASAERRRYASFGEFYPHYLNDHQNPRNRKYHFIGTGLFILLVARYACIQDWWLLPLMPIALFAFGLFGHAKVEKNKPATRANPIYSLMADFRMFWDVLSHRIHIK